MVPLVVPLLVQVGLLLGHGDAVLILTGGVAGTAGAALPLSAQPQPFWHRALPALAGLLQGAETGGAVAGARLHRLELTQHLVHYQRLRGARAGQAFRGIRGGQT